MAIYSADSPLVSVEKLINQNHSDAKLCLDMFHCGFVILSL